MLQSSAQGADDRAGDGSTVVEVARRVVRGPNSRRGADVSASPDERATTAARPPGRQASDEDEAATDGGDVERRSPLVSAEAGDRTRITRRDSAAPGRSGGGVDGGVDAVERADNPEINGAAANGAAGSGEVPLDPPDDPDEWSDDQWLQWLRQGDPDVPEPQSPVTRMHRSTGGQVLGNAMLGLAEAMYGQKRPEIVLEVDAASDPDSDGMEVHLDPDHPERSTVVVRRRGRRRPPADPQD